MTDSPRPILAPALAALQKDNIFHGFFTREGGVSTGIYTSLNAGTGSDDVKAHVLQNRCRIADTLGVSAKQLVTVSQIHSADVVTVTAPFGEERPQADAMVTDIAGLALGVLTADCGPVLFADAQAGIIGAAHAGWRGALGGILDNTIAAMQKLGARREAIVAVLGPCIGPQHYETGEEFYTAFRDTHPACEKYFTPSPKKAHYYFNLWLFITERLQKLGVAEASSLDLCTYADEQRFFSYRRKTHRHEADYGRQMSVIVLRKQTL